MIKEITAKRLLSSARRPDPWFGIKYTMNLYRGCQHQCIYCDSRSECYGIEDFGYDVLVKANALDLLRDELPRKRVKGTVGTGSMNDPYMPLERTVTLAGRALAIITEHRFPVHVITKSDLVLRDADILADISRDYAAVSFTVTAAGDALSRKVEPGAPPASKRFAALAVLAQRGIYTGVTMMPILPFIEENEANIAGIVAQAAVAGGPIGLLRDGDMVTLDIPARRLDVEVSDEELARRRAEWRAPERALTGWLWRYAAMVTSGSQGRCWRCDLPTAEAEVEVEAKVKP